MHTVTSDPRAVQVRCTLEEIIVHLEDGRAVHAPLSMFKRLPETASVKQLNRLEILDGGRVVEWLDFYEGFEVAKLLMPTCPVCLLQLWHDRGVARGRQLERESR